MTLAIIRGRGVYRGFAILPDGDGWIWRDEIEPSPRRQGRARTAALARQAVDNFLGGIA